MNALPALAPAPVRAAAPTDTASDAEDSGSSGFAAALEHAREPTQAPGAVGAQPRAKDTSKAGAGVDANAETPRDKADDAVTDGEAARDDPADTAVPDLTALLPGWPPASVLAAPPTAAAATVAPPTEGTSQIAVRTLADIATSATPAPRTRAALRGEATQAPSRRDDASVAARAEPHEALPRQDDAAATAATASARATPDKQTAMTAPAAATNDAMPPLASTRPTAESTTSTATSSPLAAVPISAAAAHATPAVAAPLFEARLAPAIDSPAFAPALAHQVTWLASQGVQQARLSLNPADMGPLAVRIVLDGSQARIDFSADMAGTRAAIEASLPTLAAALHDSGLTLAGGGVFDGHARQGTPDGRHDLQSNPATAGDASDRDTNGVMSPPVRAARGLVDLIA